MFGQTLLSFQLSKHGQYAGTQKQNWVAVMATILCMKKGELYWIMEMDTFYNAGIVEQGTVIECCLYWL